MELNNLDLNERAMILIWFWLSPPLLIVIPFHVHDLKRERWALFAWYYVITVRFLCWVELFLLCNYAVLIINRTHTERGVKDWYFVCGPFLCVCVCVWVVKFWYLGIFFVFNLSLLRLIMLRDVVKSAYFRIQLVTLK